MSEEDSDFTKSWVFVDSEKKSAEDQNLQTSGIEDVSEENDNHVDSDTDSISVISESGCSYKTDEEEFVPATTTLESKESSINNPEITEVEPPDSNDEPKALNENDKIEKLLYFATSAVCALILIGFSIIVQNYFYDPSSNVNKLATDFDQMNDISVSPYVQIVKNDDVHTDNQVKSYNFKRRSQSNRKERIQNKAAKFEKVDFHDKITSLNAQIENNDLTVEDVKPNYKLSKNKCPATKFNKENCDDTDKRTKNEFKKTFKSGKMDHGNKDGKKIKHQEKSNIVGESKLDDETYNEKIKKLKMKEHYLKEKEKFLIEKEHDLMKKEIKLNKEKHGLEKNKYEKKSYFKKEKEYKRSSEEHNSKKKKDKLKFQNKYANEDNNPKYNKKYKNKEEKKRHHDQFQHKIINDSKYRKRNISGEWYIDLHKARNNLRQKEHASDWVFDRAHLRSLKRNKAHWYFQWMVDRARLRVK